MRDSRPPFLAGEPKAVQPAVTTSNFQALANGQLVQQQNYGLTSQNYQNQLLYPQQGQNYAGVVQMTNHANSHGPAAYFTASSMLAQK